MKALIDNVGKSTLINNIIKHYKKPFQWLHYYANQSKDNPKQFAEDLYNEMFSLFKSQDYIIADRAHLGESVYSPIYRGYSGDFIFDLEKNYKTDNILLVVLIDNPENLIERDDGLSFSIELEKKQKEIQLFIDAFEKSNIKNKILININNKDAEAVKEIVINFINKMEEK